MVRQIYIEKETMLNAPAVRKYQSAEGNKSGECVWKRECALVQTSPERQNKRALLLTLDNLLKSVWVHHGVKHLWAQKPWREAHKTADFLNRLQHPAAPWGYNNTNLRKWTKGRQG